MRGLIFILIASIALFIPYLLRPLPYGFDPFHFVNEFGLTTPTVAVLCFLSFLVSGVIFYHISGKKVTPFFLALGSPAWLIHFWKFENELLAMPFLMLALYFYLKEKDWHALACLIPAGYIFKGSFLYLISFAGGSFVYWPLAAIVLFINQTGPGIYQFGINNIKGFLPIHGVAESHILVNTLAWGFLYIPFLKMLGDLVHDKVWPKTRLEKATAILCVLSILNGRWVALAVPFLALLLRDWLDKKGAGPYLVVVLGSLVLFGSMLYHLNVGPPLPADIDLIHEADRLAWIENKPFKNTWPVGYWVDYVKPGISTARAGGVWSQDFNGSVVVSHAPLTGFWVSEFEACDRVRAEKNSILWFC